MPKTHSIHESKKKKDGTFYTWVYPRCCLKMTLVEDNVYAGNLTYHVPEPWDCVLCRKGSAFFFGAAYLRR